MHARFTGFDSAWGANNTGAICELLLQDDGCLMLGKHQPVSATWNDAIERVGQDLEVGLSIWAIDQPICVGNESGCRPVEADLARALMADFGCGAHSSNLRNPCWGPDARIWDLLRAFARNGYQHHPMAIPGLGHGRHYFECYPHPAILGLFDLDRISKYKVRHRNHNAWQELIGLLKGLAARDLPIANIDAFVTEDLQQNQDNEDKVDAIICAYVAAYWWRYGMARSTMIGDTVSGYIVTPHSERTQLALAKVFSGRLNMDGAASVPDPPAGPHEDTTPIGPRGNAVHLPPEPSNDWSEPVTLRATDTTNLWRKSGGVVINSWMNADRMEGWHLWVRFLEEDGEPAVLFLPFAEQGPHQGGMRSAKQQLNRELWRGLVAEATRANPLDFRIIYHYEQC